MSKKNKEEQGNKVIVGDLPINIALRKFKQKVEEQLKIDKLEEKTNLIENEVSEIKQMLCRKTSCSSVF